MRLVVYCIFTVLIFSTSAWALLPVDAVLNNYINLTFESTFDGDIDVFNSRNKGYRWYTSKFFGWEVTDPKSLTINHDNTLTIAGAAPVTNYSIATAAPGDKKRTWIGTAFGGGGYF